MTFEETIALADALGWPVAVSIFIALMLMKNGGLRLIMRGEREDEIGAMVKDMKEIETSVKDMNQRIHKIEKDLAVLNDRSIRTEAAQ